MLGGQRVSQGSAGLSRQVMDGVTFTIVRTVNLFTATGLGTTFHRSRTPEIEGGLGRTQINIKSIMVSELFVQFLAAACGKAFACG